MLFEYAVEPQAIGSSWQTFLYLIEKFGFDRGRLISRLPGKWERKVIQAAKEAGVPDIRMASIIERLRNSKQRIADFGRAYDSEKSWMDNALTEHQRAPFHAIVARENPEMSAVVVCLSDLDEEHPLIEAKKNLPVVREANTIAHALSGILRVSTRILFVDPYFDPYNGRYKSTLRECLAHVNTNGNSVTCEIHYRYHTNKPTNTEMEKEAAKLFNGIIPKGVTVAVYCWRMKKGGADFHARYLLTELAGVAVDAGFSAEGTPQTTDMHLMSYALAQARLNTFARGATEFELVEPVLEIAADGSVRRI